MSYKVEGLELGGWCDAEWTEDDAPLRFETIEAGLEAIAELIADTEAAVRDGNMADAESADSYRVVVAESDPFIDSLPF